MTISQRRTFLLTLFTCFMLAAMAVLAKPVSADISTDPTSHNFGAVFANLSASRQIFTIANSSASPVSVTSIAVTGTDATQFTVVPLTCPDLAPTLQGVSSCTVEASFSPTRAGTMSASLDVRFGTNGQQIVALNGTGVMQNYALSLSILGDGAGTVNSSPGIDIACSTGICTSAYPSGTTLSLTPAAAPGSLLTGWSGCDSVINSVCSVTFNSAKNITASFARDISLTNYMWQGAGPTGGNITSIAVSSNFPTDNAVFAGTAGGVFRSTDRGANWTAVNSGLGSLKVSAVALSPGYSYNVGTDRTVLTVTAAGLFKSTDDGESWEKVGVGSDLDGAELTSVAFSPDYSTDRTIFAGSTNGVFGSSDAGITWASLSTGLSSRNILALAISPNFSESNMMLSATSGGLFVSYDRGANWFNFYGFQGSEILSLAFSPNYGSDRTFFAGSATGGIYRFSMDPEMGNSWISVTPTNPPSTQPVKALEVSPDYATDYTVFAGTGFGIYRSSNGGSSWNFMEAVSLGSHFFTALAISPTYSADQTLFAGSLGSGVLISNDSGLNWFVTNAGISAHRITSVAYSPNYSADQTAFATAYGGIYRTSNNGLSWSNKVDGIEAVDFKAVAVSPNFAMDRTVFAGSNGGAYRTIDSGDSWLLIKSGLSINSIVLSANYATDRTVYISSPSAEIFRSTDAGDTWESINSGLTGRTVNSIALSVDGLFAATDSGVYRFNGTLWQAVSAGKVAGGDSTTHSLGVSPSYGDDRTLYAGTHGNGIIFSNDGGVTWYQANSGLDNLDVQAIVLTPAFSSSRTIFAATSGGGIFRSTNAGAQWTSYNNNLVTHDIEALAVSPAYSSDSRVLAGTSGSGVFRLVIAEPVIAVSPVSVDFGSVPILGTSGTRTISIINSGVLDLRVSNLAIEGADMAEFNFSLGTCPSFTPVLVSGTSCSININFNPTTVGGKAASFAVSSDATSTPVKVVPLSGTAYDPPPYVNSIRINNGDALTTSIAVIISLEASDQNSSGSVTEMRFSNDSLAWSDWDLFSATVNWSLSPLGGDGLKTVYVQVKDNAGNISSIAQASITLNSALPITTITSMPTSQYNLSSGFFEFVASKPSTFRCRIDSGPEDSCSSPFTFLALADGPHSFSVYATDLGGIQGATASYSWTIDTISPETSISSSVSAYTNLTSVGFTFSSTESGVSYRCSVDSGIWIPCTATYNLTGLSNGPHNISVFAVDQAGNADSSPANFSWTVDTIPPVTTMSGKPGDPTNQQTMSISFNANEAVTSYDCTLDGVSYSACTSPFVRSNLAEGAHTFSIRATDLAANVESAAATFSWTIDLTVPSPPLLVSVPAYLVNNTSATFEFSSDAGTTLQCSLDGAGFSPCTSPTIYNGLSEGIHTFIVQATDTAANTSTTSYGWEIDVTPPPVPEISSGPNDPSSSIFATFTFSSSTAGSYLCSLDSGPWTECGTTKTVVGLTNGLHSFSVQAVDASGNVSDPSAPYIWTVNVEPVPRAVRLWLGEQYYSNINDALNGLYAQTQALQLQKDVVFVENVVVDKCGKEVTFAGGFTADFGNRVGTTSMYGTFTAKCGTTIVDGLIIN